MNKIQWENDRRTHTKRIVKNESKISSKQNLVRKKKYERKEKKTKWYLYHKIQFGHWMYFTFMQKYTSNQIMLQKKYETLVLVTVYSLFAFCFFFLFFFMNKRHNIYYNRMNMIPRSSVCVTDAKKKEKKKEVSY